MDWSISDFIKYNDNLGMYETCGIFPNWRRPGYHLSIRTYGSFDKPDYRVVKELTDLELINALIAKIPNWGLNKIKIRVKAVCIRSN